MKKIIITFFLCAFNHSVILAASQVNPDVTNIFTLSGTFKITDMIVEQTIYGEAYDPIAMRVRATILSSTRTTGGGMAKATTNKTPVVSGSFNNKVDITGGLTSFSQSSPHVIQKDQTIQLSFNSPFILSIWASDSPGSATATASIENPIAPPTYKLVNSISLGDPKATQVGPSLP